MTIYLDTAATTPLDPAVREVMLYYFDVEYGNAGSRTHVFGLNAKKAVNLAREQVADVVSAKADEVIFTSGATEANNLAILGLEKYGNDNNKKHIITSMFEHKAVLEPIEEMERRGFDITYIKPSPDGRINSEEVISSVREDTLLISIMHVNNETGVIQPITEIADRLSEHQVYFHTDAAQGFGKDLEALTHTRIDMISVSGHKIYGPKGVGALVNRRRKYKRVPLSPLMFGGGQEKGLRPGTLPVPLIAGFGEAAKQAVLQHSSRTKIWQANKAFLLEQLEGLNASINGAPDFCVPNILNFTIDGVDSESVILALKDIAAVSNGSACTSSSYKPSHVLIAMGQSTEKAEEATRVSFGIVNLCDITIGKITNALVSISPL